MPRCWLGCFLYAAVALGLHVVPLIPHHRLVERRRHERRQLIDDLQIDPLYQGIGTHYVDLWIGCPPQRQTVIVDTGSADTAFPCYGCEECGAAVPHSSNPHPEHHNHIDSVYRQNESSCFQYLLCSESEPCPDESVCSLLREDNENPFDLPESSLHPPFLNSSLADRVCHMGMAYMEGSSWIALQSIDRAYTGGSHFAVDSTEAEHARFSLTFGCQTAVEGLFATQLADGILGMMKSPRSYWWQLYNAGIIQEQQFSLCFTTNPVITYAGTDAGAMVLGGTDPRLHTTPMVFAEMVDEDSSDAMELVLENIHLRRPAGESIVPTHVTDWYTLRNLTRKMKGVVDSGATSTHLTNEFYEPFRDAFWALTGLEYDTQKTYSFASHEQMTTSLPTVLFQFQASAHNEADPNFDGFSNNGKSILVALPPSSYMKYYPNEDVYSPKIFFRDFGLSLGANFLSGKDVLFDVEHKRIGFAESSCDYLSLHDPRFNHSEAAWEAQQPTYSNPDATGPNVPLATLVGLVAIIASFGIRVFYKKTRMVAFQPLRLQEVESFESYSDDDVFETEMVLTSLERTDSNIR
ncbi:hypothetical protein FisN_22Lh058 [Fistulifera solaris]|uniref:Peptidase A1 domain-containing protein n=1 Tax=Fistulifera solaris TaxID=1519565 RepID=A0A1Z5JBQ8_FISSO|nr:hypothetical protein FisN_22Lh058 [Fistulifera solaris]|eukprot:GAX11386.1 hypothetical protein FisN_22Lh058 [Fistulifera solaris]